jgi:uncharacterized protein (TIGR00255 family)
MTGFGAATREGPAGSVAWELRSINNRAVKVSLRIPSALAGWEADFEGRVREALSRGSVSGTLRADRAGAAQGPVLDRALAKRYAEALAELASELGLSGEPDLRMVAQMPGVVLVSPGTDEGTEALARTAGEALAAALAELDRSRSREGAALGKDFAKRVRAVEKALGVVGKRAPKAAGVTRTRLAGKLKDALAGHPEVALRDAVAREIAVLAERGDVTEEVTRLKHHIASFRAAAAGRGEVGRRLDFLLQEMLREINTIGSKSQDAAIAAAVVDMKVEVDRMKEQAANIE